MAEERSPLYVMKNLHDPRPQGEVDEWEVSSRRIKLLKIVGQGNFGVVYLAKFDKKNHEYVAVKMLKAHSNTDEVNDFLGEIRMLKIIGKHPHVVSLVGCCTLEQPYCSILEYASGGDLFRKLKSLRQSFDIRRRMVRGYSESSSRHPSESSTLTRVRSSVAETEYTTLSEEVFPTGKKDNSTSLGLRKIEGNSVSSNGSDTFTDSDDFTISDYKMSPLKQGNKVDNGGKTVFIDQIMDSRTLYRYALQIAKGMAHLESKGIVHRDLAARNVLIDNRGNLKVADFGLSRHGVYVPVKQNALPLRWMAVEAIRDYYFSTKSDVWSFAVVLWEIGNLGAFPYEGIDNESIKHFLMNGRRLDKPEAVSQELYDIMLQCWDSEPDKRPSFTDLVSYLEIDDDRCKRYIDLNTLRQDYVFPPIEQITFMTEKRLKDLAKNNDKVI